MTSVNEAVIRYIAAWNERDPRASPRSRHQNLDRRRRYTDLHRQAVGHDGIDRALDRCRQAGPN